MRARPWVLVLAALALVASAGAGWSATGIYRWTDDGGTIHYSQGIDTVPPRYRAAAVIIGHDRPAPPLPEPAPAPTTPPGVARVSFTPGQPIMVAARINGGGAVQLMLDTGATRTVITPSALMAVGVSHQDALRGTIRGVTGEAQALAVRVESLEVGGARHGPLLVISHDTGFQHGDGLLGRDFLDYFTVTIDNGAGVVTLAPR